MFWHEQQTVKLSIDVEWRLGLTEHKTEAVIVVD